MAAGTIMPPSAAMAGKATLLASESSPITASRLISRPTSRKKIAISRSLTQTPSGLSSANSPSWILKCVCSSASYPSASGEFAAIIASTPATTSRMPLADSSLRNSRIATREPALLTSVWLMLESASGSGPQV